MSPVKEEVMTPVSPDGPDDVILHKHSASRVAGERSANKTKNMIYSLMPFNVKFWVANVSRLEGFHCTCCIVTFSSD